MALVVVSSQADFLGEAEAACARAALTLERAAFPAEARRLADRAAAILVDSRSLSEGERGELFDSVARVLFIDSPEAGIPASDGRPVRRLAWPASDQALSDFPWSRNAWAFLVEGAAVVGAGLEERLRQVAGGVVWAPSIESASALAPALAGSPPAALLVPWSGSSREAARAAGLLRRRAPELEVAAVDSRSPLRAAAQALAAGEPASLPRALLAAGVELLAGKAAADPSRLGRILALDADPKALALVSGPLIEEGFDVSACARLDQAEARAAAGAEELAILPLGLPSAAESARGLREADPGLGLLLLIDREPLDAALEQVGSDLRGVVEECVLRPFEPARLAFAARRALDRRRLRLRNEALLRELRETNARLDARARFQSSLLAMVAHDLRTPLSAVGALAQEVGACADSEVKAAAEGTRAAARAVTDAVEDLVDLAAIEAGKLRVEPRRADLSKEAEEAAASVLPLFASRRVALRRELAAAAPVRADPARLRQALRHLCLSALERTPSGGRVSVRAQGLRVQVEDDGLPIPPSELERAFTLGFRNPRAAEGEEGLGLGLFIARELLAAHGAELASEALPGRGSRFSFTLPPA